MFRSIYRVIQALVIGLFVISPLSAVAADFVPGDIGFGHSYVTDTIPDRLEPGRTYPILITFKNVGLVTWESRTNRVGLVYNGNLNEIVALPVFVEIPSRATVSQGENVSFALSLLPVGIPGLYEVSFYVAYQTAQGDQQVTETWKKTVTIVPTHGISSPVNGSIAVESIIEGLSVTLAGSKMGTVPCIIPDLTPGRYDIEVRGASYSRIIPVQVEKGTLSKVFIDNITTGPRIELVKAGIVSDGTLFGYIEANISLVLIILLFVLFCIGLMIHAVRIRRNDQEEDKKKGKRKKGKKKGETYDPASEERDLLDEYHQKHPVFDATFPGSDPGSGSQPGETPELLSPGRMKNVRDFSRDMLDKNLYENKEGGIAGGRESSSNPSGNPGGIEISLRGFEVRPGSGRAQVAALNNTPESLTVEGHLVESGAMVEIPVEIPEPLTDEYTVTISLKILQQAGHSFYHALQIPYNRGIALLARGVYEKAYDYFLDVAKKNPRHLDALLKKATILMEWSLDEEAEMVIDQILSIDPDHHDARQLSDEIRSKKKKRELEKETGPERKKIPGFPDSLYDRYTPVRILGKDSFASIFLAIRNDNEEIRALKVAHEDVMVGSGLYTEISVLYQLRHPNVLKMFKAEFTPCLFLELEYSSGVTIGGIHCRTLADIAPPLPDEIFYQMIEGIASGLAYLHMKGVRHYHLSPRYILLDEPMTPKISGLMRSSLMPVTGAATKDPMIIRAPEQINPEKYGKKGIRTDLFQLGVIWYWMMTGAIPYGGHPVSEDGSVTGVYLPVGIVSTDLAIYDPLMKRLLAPDKHNRYGSAGEFLAELRGLRL